MIQLYRYEPEPGEWKQEELSHLPRNLPDDIKIWIDLQQADSHEQQKVLQHFNIHPMLAEDFMRDRHPPKLEVHHNFSLLILRAFADPDFSTFSSNAQFNLLYSNQVLISRSVQADTLYQNIRPPLSKNHKQTISSWVKKAIITVFSSYFDKMISFSEEITDLEDIMLQHGNDDYIALIMRYRSVLRKVTRNLAYQKDLFDDALYEEGNLFRQQFELPEIRDFYEKFERLHSMSELCYEQLGDLVHGYMSTSSHQINERMKVLTIVSSIFIPLTFIAGIYGMNFVNMPELQSSTGYFIVLIIMAILGFGALIWFKIRGWW
ncbi:magnesium transporter CorA family protein [Chromatiaceae bacterium AAb-1]|nr:magnesium transporter CorA family protein [Chromatiaceae bacterium AAb-1]